VMKVALVVALAVATAASAAIAADYGSAPQEYKQYCASCHGETGAGNGPLGTFLTPRPRDFADCNVMKKIDDKTIFDAIKNGGAAVSLSPNMPAWGGSLNDKQIHEMVKYVRHFCSETASK
jgi:cytochrome c oxidase cbb3-type subunit 3